MRHIFDCGGYAFWQDDEGYWQVTRQFDPAPTRGAYASPSAIALLKGLNLHYLTWVKPAPAVVPHAG